jgi:tRNA pseudouridine38-40 synthase
MRTLKLTVAYDGTNYAGWQRQANAVAVQQVVEEAFAPLVGGVPPTIAGASRTDAGVHALGQVASVHVDFEFTPVAVQRALNVRLPADIRVVGVVDERPGFHARFHAAGKTYRYRIVTTPVVSPFERWFVWHAPWPRDVAAMRRAAEALVGRHDFSAFQPAGEPPRHAERTLRRLDIHEGNGGLTIEIEGDGFLRHMARTIVGTLDEIGAGSRPVESARELVGLADRRSAGRTAPAQGLTLVSVRYE